MTPHHYKQNSNKSNRIGRNRNKRNRAQNRIRSHCMVKEMKIETERGMDGGSELILNKLRIGHQFICTQNVYDLRREFQQRLKSMETETQAQTIHAITSFDTN